MSLPSALLRALCCALALLAFGVSAEAGLTAEVQALLAKAMAGDPLAQYRVGVAYDYGRGAPADPVVAMKWYRTAADAGYADAQNSVGSLLQAEAKFAEAFEWFEKAAAQEHPRAVSNLAYLYESGQGVAQDARKAFELYARAANLGFGDAMFNLSGMHGGGALGEPDIATACVWTLRAARFAGPKEEKLKAAAARRIGQIEPHLSSEQMARCREQAASWSPENVTGSPSKTSTGEGTP